MKLITMISFVKKKGNIGMQIQSISHQQSDLARRFFLIQKYADFLLKDLKKGMFVPCDEFDNILEEPLAYNFKSVELFTNYNIKYQQAKELVLFKGFKVLDYKHGSLYSKVIVDSTGFIHLFWFDKISQTWEISRGLANIESLTKFGGIELTEIALKEIGLLEIINND